MQEDMACTHDTPTHTRYAHMPHGMPTHVTRHGMETHVTRHGMQQDMPSTLDNIRPPAKAETHPHITMAQMGMADMGMPQMGMAHMCVREMGGGRASGLASGSGRALGLGISG